MLEWKGASLWWMAEAFFASARGAPACVRLVETWLRILEAEAPDEVEAVGLPARESVLLERAATSRGVLTHGRPPRAPSGRTRIFRAWLKSFRSEARRRGVPAPGSPTRFLLVTEEDDLTALTNEHGSDEIRHVSLKDLRERGCRATRRETWRCGRRFRTFFAELRKAPGVHEAFSHRGVPFFDLAEADLAELLFVALPRAVHLFEEMAGILAAGTPEAVALLVASRDERRALLAACGADDVPGVVLRTGDGEEDRADGGPRPELVLAWNGSASPEDVREALREASRIRTARTAAVATADN
jgi:hypothetical protein